MLDHGPTAKQDYAVDIQGPIVAQIRGFALRAIVAGHRGAAGAGQPREALPRLTPLTHPPEAVGQMAAIFVTRDNRHHSHDIEKHYRIAIRGARQRVVIANAYFFPGYRLLRDMRRAARRGVRVELILQGEPDMPIVKIAASLLYHHLITAGVRIFEYRERPLHGKVAISDQEWSTVGSSNLDPLSLSLNLEANLVIRDHSFNRELTLKLDQLMRQHCHEVLAEELKESNWWRVVRSFFVFHVIRHYPLWAGWLPMHQPQLTPAEKLFKAGADRLGG